MAPSPTHMANLQFIKELNPRVIRRPDLKPYSMQNTSCDNSYDSINLLPDSNGKKNGAPR